MATVSMQEAQAKLPDLIHKLLPGDEVVITEDNVPVAKLVGEQPPQRKPRVAGNCKGMISLLVEDDEHLADFKEYME